MDNDSYVESLDGVRIGRQSDAVLGLMSDGKWRTLREIANFLGFPEASISARLRQFRTQGMIVERRRLADPERGLFAYSVLAPMQLQSHSERW